LAQDLQEHSPHALLCLPSTTAIFPSFMRLLVCEALPLKEALSSPALPLKKLLLRTILPLQDEENLLEAIVVLAPH
jgi:hypothetical protein